MSTYLYTAILTHLTIDISRCLIQLLLEMRLDCGPFQCALSFPLFFLNSLYHVGRAFVTSEVERIGGQFEPTLQILARKVGRERVECFQFNMLRETIKAIRQRAINTAKLHSSRIGRRSQTRVATMPVALPITFGDTFQPHTLQMVYLGTNCTLDQIAAVVATKAFTLMHLLFLGLAY